MMMWEEILKTCPKIRDEAETQAILILQDKRSSPEAKKYAKEQLEIIKKIKE